MFCVLNNRMNKDDALNMLPVFIMLFIVIILFIKGEFCNRRN